MFDPLSDRNLPMLLRLTGGMTMLSVFQFLAPAAVLQAQGMAVGDATGLFFAQHWALLVCCMAGLLIYSASRPELRVPAVIAIGIEKLGLVVMMLIKGADPAFAGLRGAAIFDSICVVLFSIWLWRQLRAGK